MNLKRLTLLFTLLVCAEFFINHEADALSRSQRCKLIYIVRLTLLQISRPKVTSCSLEAQNCRAEAQADRAAALLDYYICLFGEKLGTKKWLDQYSKRRKRSLNATQDVSDNERFLPQDASRFKLMTCSLAELFSQRGECARHQLRRRHRKDIKAVQKVLDGSNRLLSILKMHPATEEALRNTSCPRSLPLLSACALGYPGISTLPTKLTHDSGGMETDLTPCRIAPVYRDSRLTWQECDQRGVAGLVRQNYILAYLGGDAESLGLY